MPVQVIQRGFEIERVDKEARTVAGYCYRTADCGDGWDIPRDVMEAMTPGYLEWSNVREMHGKRAVGVSRVEWDDIGCFMTAEIVDDEAWSKVEAGVYKGFSIGVKPSKAKKLDSGVMRVVTGKWFETSLVDRPADPETRFELCRADGDGDEVVEVEDTDASSEDTPVAEQPETTPAETPAVEAERWAACRGELADKIKDAEPMTLARQAWNVLDSFVWGLFYGESHAAPIEAEVRAAFDDVRDYIAPLLGKPDIDRAESGSLPTTIAHYFAGELVSRAETERDEAKAEVARLQALIDVTPNPDQTKPQKITATHLIRQFSESIKPDEDKRETARAEINRILSGLNDESTDDERTRASVRIDQLKREGGL